MERYLSSIYKDSFLCFLLLLFQIESDFRNFLNFNSKCYDIPVEEGKLIIFPSRLMHDVSRNTQDDLRISLSFNTWIKGEVGSKENADYLKL